MKHLVSIPSIARGVVCAAQSRPLWLVKDKQIAGQIAVGVREQNG